MGSSKKAVAAPLLPRKELELVVREAIRAASALKSTEIKKALPRPNQSQHEEALAIARDLALRGEIYRWTKGRAEWFFASEPVAILENAVSRALAAGALEAAPLQQRIALETKVPKAYFDEWKKNALARGGLFKVAGASAAATKTTANHLALLPDLREVLRVAIAELRKGMKALDAKGVSRELIARVLWEELGLPAAASSAGPDERRAFLKALRDLASEHPSGTLLELGELRRRLPLDKTRFDATALSLSHEGAIILHHHDHAEGLTEDERSRLVRDDRGTYYVGLALKPV